MAITTNHSASMAVPKGQPDIYPNAKGLTIFQPL